MNIYFNNCFLADAEYAEKGKTSIPMHYEVKIVIYLCVLRVLCEKRLLLRSYRTFSNSDFGALQTGQVQSSGSFSNGVPSFTSSYS